ncbi:hypothetical protein [Spirosoma agri]|uniref:Uncharacterized protein n=1 Tax=Spirosoma agri TaxID=1987381 RepID=A0A6M0INI3_9BACT|nr:hypothetical protein [Spirosoma agri]NEU69869.1 hypothetical protein [Spirosoma agri]
MPTGNLPTQPAFTITAQAASNKQGIINVPASVDSYFGEHGKIVVITLPDDQRIHCTIERRNTAKSGARLSHPLLKEYFGNKSQRGWEYRAKIVGTNAISIRPIEPATEPVDELVGDPADESITKSIDESVAEPTNESVAEPADESVVEPVDGSQK